MTFINLTALLNYQNLSVKPFLIGDDLQNIVIKKGQVIKYDIKYGGEPEPEVVWQLNGVEVKDDNDK